MSTEAFVAIYKAKQVTPETSSQPEFDLPIWRLTCHPPQPFYSFLLRSLSRKYLKLRTQSRIMLL